MGITRIFYLFLTIAMLMISIPAYSATDAFKKIYPPYPKVWGYDLSEIPAMKWGLANVAAYAMEDGDIWFLITHSYEKSNPLNCLSDDINNKYILLKFFKGEKTELSQKAVEQFYKRTEDKDVLLQYINGDLMFFQDGSKLSIHYGRMPDLCFIPDFCLNYFIKTDTKGKETKHSVLVAAPQVSIHQDENLGEEEGAPFFYQKLHGLTSVIPLKDDTFIVFQNGGNLILRLDKNFKTQFKPASSVFLSGNYIMRNFFIVDYNLIESYINKFARKPIPVYQNVHDALFLHFHNQYPDK